MMFAHLPANVILLLQQGDETSFNEVYVHYADLLFVIISSITKDPERSKDVLQDTFLTMYSKIATLADPAKFHPWIIAIARNGALNAKKELHESLLEPEQWDQVADNVRQDDFISAWHSFLNEQENLIIAYKIVYELTFAEISKLTERPLASVYLTYRQALQKLKTHYGAK